MSAQIQTRNHRILIFVQLFCLLLTIAFTSSNQSSASEDTCVISTQADLMAINISSTCSNYVLRNDIKMTDILPDSGYYIGDGMNVPNLIVNFDGANHTISNLKGPLFQTIGRLPNRNSSHTITTVSHLNLLTSAAGFLDGGVGILAEEIYEYTNVVDVHVTGKITRQNRSSVGGIAARAEANTLIMNSSAEVTVILNNEDEDAGGLVGSTQGNIINSYSKIVISGEANGHVGGLVGASLPGSKIVKSASSGSISAGGESEGANFGGLVGYTEGATIENSFSSVDISTNQDSYVGGLIASANPNGATPTKISNSYASGNVSNSGYNSGGLVGFIYKGEILNSISTGNVSGNINVGGLVGYSESTKINAGTARGRVTGSKYIGGLVGYFSTISSVTIAGSLSTGSINYRFEGSISSPGYVGKLIGFVGTNATLSNVTATGEIHVETSEVSSPTHIGGLFGDISNDQIPSNETTGLFRTPLEKLNTLEDGTPAAPSLWAESANVNSNNPYLLALLDGGFYHLSISYSVIYDLGGGVGTLPIQVDLPEGSSFTTAISSNFSKVGYTFSNWSDGLVELPANSSYENLTRNLTLTAIWTINTSVAPIVVYIPPPPQPYLIMVTPPSIQKVEKIFTCSAGKYNYGVTYFDGTPNSLTNNVSLTKINYEFNVDNIELKDLSADSDIGSMSIPESKFPKSGLLTCFVTVEFGGISTSASSILNTSGIREAEIQRKINFDNANTEYQLSFKENGEKKNSAILINHKTWRDAVEFARAEFASSKTNAKNSKEVVAASRKQSLAVANAAANFKRGIVLIDIEYREKNALADKIRRNSQTTANLAYANILELIGYGIYLDSNF